MNYKYIINTCSKCDISIRCSFIPSRGQGEKLSLAYILPSPTKSEYTKGEYTRVNKIIKDFNDSYGFNAYFTYLVKCIGKSELKKSDIANCKQYLIDELYNVKPRVIITIGDVVTSEFLEYTRFKDVVDIPHKYELNGEFIIIYPIYHPSFKYDNIDVKELYVNSFKTIAKLYKGLINNKYFIYE